MPENFFQKQDKISKENSKKIREKLLALGVNAYAIKEERLRYYFNYKDIVKLGVNLEKLSQREAEFLTRHIDLFDMLHEPNMNKLFQDMFAEALKKTIKMGTEVHFSAVELEDLTYRLALMYDGKLAKKPEKESATNSKEEIPDEPSPLKKPNELNSGATLNCIVGWAGPWPGLGPTRK